jgi:hypothetical protein
VWYELDEAQDLLADLEDARDALIEANQLSATMRIEERSAASAVSWDSTNEREAPMSTELLRASEAARRMGLPTRDLVRLMYDHKLRYVMVDGIAHVPADALDKYRATAS